jgi:general secretion pathway protein A
MYHPYFGLKESPFSISVNPRYLFMSPRHRDALAHLLYGVGSGGGFILLTGEVGTGKTTINRCLLDQLPDSTDLAIVLNPALSAVELLATVCDEFEIEYPRDSLSLKRLTDALHGFLLDNHAGGRRSVLMIDEAQHLDFDVLEQIRLLTNLETNDEKLLQIILIGQPELTEKLARPELRQLNQRITARYNLQPLNREETEAYIQHRLHVAGLAAGRTLFPKRVVREIHRRTQGIPRQINLLCDRTLLGAYGRQQTHLTRRLVRSAAVEVFGVHERGILSRRTLAAALTVLLASSFFIWFVWFSEAMPSTLGDKLLDLPTFETSDTADTKPQDASSAVAFTPLKNINANANTSVKTPSFLIAPSQAATWLWQLNSDAPRPVQPCAPFNVAGLRCQQDNAEVWDSVIGLNRPVVLAMQTPDKFRAETLVVGFEARAAWVMADTGIELVPLVELAQYWLGGYRYFWKAPQGWQQPLKVDDESALVAQVAGWFAELDGQSTALASDVFTERLAARIRLFQEEQNLAINGWLDQPTLMQIAILKGEVSTQASLLARAQLVWESL